MGSLFARKRRCSLHGRPSAGPMATPIAIPFPNPIARRTKNLSPECLDFVKSLLTDADKRLGRGEWGRRPTTRAASAELLRL
jgi:hypothetical protein